VPKWGEGFQNAGSVVAALAVTLPLGFMQIALGFFATDQTDVQEGFGWCGRVRLWRMLSTATGERVQAGDVGALSMSNRSTGIPWRREKATARWRKPIAIVVFGQRACCGRRSAPGDEHFFPSPLFASVPKFRTR